MAVMYLDRDYNECTKEEAVYLLPCKGGSVGGYEVIEDVVTLKTKDIAKFSPTAEQRKWVDDECKKTKESQATVMRKLIQEKIDEK